MSITSPASISLTSETDILQHLLQRSDLLSTPFALWRLPHRNSTALLLSDEIMRIQRDSIVLEDMQSGFLFAPFDPSGDNLFLKADYLFQFENGTLQRTADPIHVKSVNWLEERMRTPASSRPAREQKTEIHSSSPSSYEATVRKAIQAIEEGKFEKVVPSRCKTISLPEDFDILKVFQALCERYAHAMVSVVSIPGQGIWMGATPELLLSVEEKTIFKTVALAGTKPYTEGMNLKAVAWTQKEIEEQALVERYIISCLKKIRLREYEEHGPKTVIAGNLMHLKSDFKVDMKATNFPQLGSVMLRLLHPTSAVCGMPLEPALEFLRAHEGYDRSFFAGYLGPVNIDQHIHLFVNLRCMHIRDTTATLYAGAGVTIDSSPEAEFEETEMKMNTLLKVIHSA